MTALYRHLVDLLLARGLTLAEPPVAPVTTTVADRVPALVPADRVRYLAEIASTVRSYHATTAEQAAAVASVGHLEAARGELDAAGLQTHDLDALLTRRRDAVSGASLDLLACYDRDAQRLTAPERPVRISLSDTLVPRIALPRTDDRAELFRWLRRENLPGRFPFTGGAFETRRDDEDPTRMFAGEGGPQRTNRRFHMLSRGQSSTRLSTAFDSVTLYGADPSVRPDIYGKIGTSGVSVATLEDMRELYAGFDLIEDSTSVSMTINGPAPAILAMFLNTAIDQHPELEPAEVLRRVRGTVQADILKGGPGSEHLHPLHRVRPVDDGRHPGVVRRQRRAQLLLGVDLGLPHRRSGSEPDQPAGVHTRQRIHLRGGLPGPRNGDRRLRRQPVVLLLQRDGPGVHGARPGRTAHLGDRHAGPLRRQRAQPEAEVPRPDLRSVTARPGNGLQRRPHDPSGPVRHLRQRQQPPHQRLRRGSHHPHRRVGATCDGDPAHHQPRVGPCLQRQPAAGFVHRGGAHRPGGISGPRGARPDQRAGGVLGAMETGYQRGRIQDESMRYEQAKHDGTLPIIGVNTFRPSGWEQAERPAAELRRSDDAEKRERLEALAEFRRRQGEGREPALAALGGAVLGGHNTFEALMRAVRHCTLGEITETLFVLGGRYRRNA
ncbi:MAG: methylmalonyl-CoA mutase family protein [Microthrixaceae bacterium]|nr:methylmalonyl-CoA mutase family protein [Microthrixaceae bacterium]